jgi:hypothetical protein
MVANIPTSTQIGRHHTYIYSMPVAAILTSTQCRLPPHLHLLKTVAAIPTSTQCWLPPYLHLLNAGCCHTYIYSKRKKGRNVFRFMKLEESMAGEDSEPAGTCSKLAGKHFTIGKKKSDENSGVQKVQNWNNRGILQNSEQISQSRYNPAPCNLSHHCDGLCSRMMVCK